MIISKERIVEIWNKYNIYLMIFVIFSPIFVSLDFTQGLKFDAYYFNPYLRPSVPLSLILIGILSLINLKKLIVQKELMILGSLVFVYILINVYYGLTRAMIVGIGMILPILTYYLFKDYTKNVKINYNILYFVLFAVITLKFIFDIYVHNIIINLSNETLLHDNTLYTLKNILLNMNFSLIGTPVFIHKSLLIYNYFDYFPFVYYLATVLSINNIVNKEMITKSIFLIVISFIAIQDTGSRLFIFGIYLIPLLYIFYKFTKFKLDIYFYFFIITSILITLLVGLIEFSVSDPSLLSRYLHNHKYFDDFSFINLILPFDNDYRVESSGSFHNELLEIFSFFGLISVYYYYLIKNIFCDVQDKYKLISYLVMFIIIIGSLIQINLPNPYLGIILGLVLAIISTQHDEKNRI